MTIFANPDGTGDPTADRDDGVDGRSSTRCRWCRRIVVRRRGPGRPRIFCSPACRQWDWVSRRRAEDGRVVGDDEVVVVKSELDRLHDDLYVLECAIEDTERDAVGVDSDGRELRLALDWLLEAARPLIGRDLRSPSNSTGA